MSWYSDSPERFTAELRKLVPDAGEVIHKEYEIIAPLYVSGTELCYHAKQLSSGVECLLFELIPLRWCAPNPKGRFLPYHAEASAQWERFRVSALNRLSRLQKFSHEAAVPAVKDGFESRGTIWYVTRYEDAPSLRQLMQEKTWKPKDAIRLLTPLLDTLAGMHDAGMYHGAITAYAIHIVNDSIQLRDWLSCSSLSEATASDDVRDVSRLLWQMTTGTDYYNEESAAALPAPVRSAIYNGLFDPEMTVSRLWKQLHAKKPAKRTVIRLLQSEQTPLLSRVFSPVVTAVFCAFCIAAPVVLWRMEAAAIVTETEKEPLEDVAYSLSEDEIQMPELLYLEQNEAQKMLSDLGLHVILSARENNPVVPENQVLMQSPDAGAVVHAGDTVTLTISNGWSNAVPDVSGMPLEQAKSALTELGFVIETEEKISPDDAPGIIIAQDVKPGTRLERESTVRLTVSLGREDLDDTQQVTVEDYTGMDFEKAKAALSEQLLYAVQAESVFDAEVPAGVIIRQDLEPGKQAAQGSTINFTVSKGIETAQVPDVVHLSAESARQTLEAARLQCIICYVSNAEWEIDTVLTQNVEAGSQVPLGSEIWLEVSVGSGSYVASTGGWSGVPLPTIPSTEVTTEETSETDNSEAETDSETTAVQETTASSTEPTEPTAPPLPSDSSSHDSDSDAEMTAPPMPNLE